MASRGRGTTSLNSYRLSRRGRKLQVADDQRTLLALPKDVPERTWAEILQKEENDLICFDIREEILEDALSICYDKYMSRQTTLFTVYCSAQAWLKLIDWYFYRHDPGEDPSAHPPCYIPKRVESWTPDEMPAPSPKDTWGKQQLTIMDDCAEETVAKWASSESLDMPVVEPIPQEYWFPGKVAIEIPVPVEDEQLEPDTSKTRRDRRRKQYTKRGPGGTDYTESISSDSSEDAFVEPESEILQKVTDYSTTEPDTSPKESLLTEKSGASVEGSLHGAGDSTLDKIRSKGSKGRFHKSRTGFSKLRIKSRDLGQEADSRTRLSVISDCRLRNLRWSGAELCIGEAVAVSVESGNKENTTKVEGTKKLGMLRRR